MTKTTETKQANPPSAFNRFIFNNRAMIGTLAVFLIMMAIFIVASPRVFLNWQIYNSILVTLPVALFVVVPLVFFSFATKTRGHKDNSNILKLMRKREVG